MWPWFDSWTRRHMKDEVVVGSRPCCEGFSPGSPVFLTPQKPTFPNSNSTWKQWMNSHSVDVPLKFPFIYLNIALTKGKRSICQLLHLITEAYDSDDL